MVYATPGNSLVYLSWSGYDNYNYDFRNYRITTWRYPATLIAQENIYDINQTTTTIYGLINGVSYYVSVEVQNYESDIVDYNESNTVTPPPPPPPPI